MAAVEFGGVILTLGDALRYSYELLIPELAFAAVPFREPLVAEIGLRPYQLEMILEAARLMRAGHRRILLVLPTGGGKTRMAAAMMNSASRLGYPSQFVVHRKELIDQTSGSFSALGLDHGYIASGKPFTPTADIVLAGVQTLARRLDQILPPNTVIVDESHHACASTWADVMRAYPDSYIIGLTATPERLDGKGLGGYFDVMVVGPSTADLIEWGYLSPFDYYAPEIPDLAQVGSTMGDFAKGALAEVMDKPKLVGNVVEHYLRLAKGEQGIVFAVNREHSRRLADAFRGEGVRAAHMDGSMTSTERKRLDDAFRARDLDILTNVDLLGEGYDVPNVTYVGKVRPTKSLSLNRQQDGRALRPVYAAGLPLDTDDERLAAIAAGPKRAAIICDHAGNAIQQGLGLPDTPVEWSLKGRLDRKRASGGNSDATPVRQCLVCYRVSPSTVKICPGCATAFPIQERKIKEEAGELKKLADAEAKLAAQKKRKEELRACVTYEDFKKFAIDRGYKNPEGWAKMQRKMRKDYRGFRRR